MNIPNLWVMSASTFSQLAVWAEWALRSVSICRKNGLVAAVEIHMTMPLPMLEPILLMHCTNNSPSVQQNLQFETYPQVLHKVCGQRLFLKPTKTVKPSISCCALEVLTLTYNWQVKWTHTPSHQNCTIFPTPRLVSYTLAMSTE